MSNKARKLRKRAGIKFVREPRVGTPFMERSFVTALVPGTPRTKWAGAHVPRSVNKVAKAVADRDWLRGEKKRKEKS